MKETYRGKIIKGIAGFYYVHVEEKGLFECKAKGLFRKEKIKPLVGDNVFISITDESLFTGNIEDIDARKNEIIRPACANIDMAVLVMAASRPAPKFTLLDRIMIFFEYHEIPVVLCFNKCDEITEEDMVHIRTRYERSGAKILFVSAMEGTGLDELKETLRDKTSILTGPSGAGKSSLINRLCPDAGLEVGDISRIGRGRHTTRHSEVFKSGESTFIMDTPGFTSLDVPDIDELKLRYYFNEFKEHENKCRFDGCVHIHEPGCAVKEALENGLIDRERYESYISIFEDLKTRRK